MSPSLSSSQARKRTLQEYSVEWDLRYDEAETRSNLHLNEVAYLFFKQSGPPNKFIGDVKPQIQGDLSRFADARALALRLGQRGDYTMMVGMMTGMNKKKMNGGMAMRKKINSGQMLEIGNHQLMMQRVLMDLLQHHTMTKLRTTMMTTTKEKEKGASVFGLGCQTCGSKWHSIAHVR